MIIAKLIGYLSAIVWIFPPLRQFRGRFFYYFLILALTDPIVRFLYALKIFFPNVTLYLLVSVGLLISLPQLNKYLKFVYLVPVFIFSLILIYFLPLLDLMVLIGITHLLILYIIFKYTINYIFMNGRIQVFHLLLITYETSMMLKFIDRAFAFQTGMVEFYFITGFQIILGILFCFIKEDSSRLSFRFAKP